MNKQTETDLKHILTLPRYSMKIAFKKHTFSNDAQAYLITQKPERDNSVEHAVLLALLATNCHLSKQAQNLLLDTKNEIVLETLAENEHLEKETYLKLSDLTLRIRKRLLLNSKCSGRIKEKLSYDPSETIRYMLKRDTPEIEITTNYAARWLAEKDDDIAIENLLKNTTEKEKEMIKALMKQWHGSLKKLMILSKYLAH